MRNNLNYMNFIDYLKAHVSEPIYPLRFPTGAPDRCITVEFSGGTATRGTVSTIFVQFMIRTIHPSHGETLADEILDFLDNRTSDNIGETQLILAEAQQGESIYIGTDENDRNLFSINFKLILG